MQPPCNQEFFLSPGAEVAALEAEANRLLDIVTPQSKDLVGERHG